MAHSLTTGVAASAGPSYAGTDVRDLPLIIDVGMHTAKDTEFYLHKGFRVLAIEANPDLCARADARFAAEIQSGRLTILNVAIANRDGGVVDLFVNDSKEDWSTIFPQWRERNERRGATSRVIQVPARRFEDILRDHDTPYYIKIDIEGADIYCLDGLARVDDRPKLVSIEASIDAVGNGVSELGMLYRLGYRQFKISNQGANGRVRCPSPPLEGLYVDQRFDGQMSGPFGEEIAGHWMGFDETLAKYQWLMRVRAKHGLEGTWRNTAWSRLYRRYRDHIGDPVAWWDFHGKLGDK